MLSLRRLQGEPVFLSRLVGLDSPTAHSRN